MIIITGAVEVRSESREEAVRLGIEHSARSRQEQGCIAHNCFEDTENPGRLHFFEKWESVAAVKAHFAVRESGLFIKEIGKLAIGRPEMDVFAAEPVDLTAT